MRGNQTPRECEDGANGSGEPLPRPLLRPSPSANLVGVWKGDPLGPQVAVPTVSPNRNVVPSRGDKPAQGATTSEMNYDNRRHAGGALARPQSDCARRTCSVARRTARAWRGADSGAPGRYRGEAIRHSGAAAGPIYRAGWRGRLSGRHARPRTALWLLALAVPHHQGAGHHRAPGRNCAGPRRRRRVDSPGMHPRQNRGLRQLPGRAEIPRQRR